jgi:hypothetical protein
LIYHDMEDAVAAEKTWLERNRNKKLRTLIDRDLLTNLLALTLGDPGRLNRAVQRLTTGSERIRLRLRVQDVVDEAAVVEACAHLADESELQDRIVQSVLASPIYREFMAEMLYRSIRDFLLEENFITQRLPIAGKLVRMGQSWASSKLDRLGGEAGELDAAVTKFIEGRLGIMDRYAAALLKQALTEKALRRSGAYLWEAIKDREIILDTERLKTGSHVWQQFTAGIADALVDAFMDGWGDKPLRKLI